MDMMENSDGSSEAEMEKIRQSIEYKINEFRETWVGFAQELLKRNEIADVITSATSASTNLQKVIKEIAPYLSLILNTVSTIFEILGKIVDTLGGATVPLGIIGGYTAKNFKTFKQLFDLFRTGDGWISVTTASLKAFDESLDENQLNRVESYKRSLQQVDYKKGKNLKQLREKATQMDEEGTAARQVLNEYVTPVENPVVKANNEIIESNHAVVDSTNEVTEAMNSEAKERSLVSSAQGNIEAIKQENAALLEQKAILESEKSTTGTYDHSRDIASAQGHIDKNNNKISELQRSKSNAEYQSNYQMQVANGWDTVNENYSNRRIQLENEYTEAVKEGNIDRATAIQKNITENEKNIESSARMANQACDNAQAFREEAAAIEQEIFALEEENTVRQNKIDTWNKDAEIDSEIGKIDGKIEINDEAIEEIQNQLSEALSEIELDETDISLGEEIQNQLSEEDIKIPVGTSLADENLTSSIMQMSGLTEAEMQQALAGENLAVVNGEIISSNGALSTSEAEAAIARATGVQVTNLGTEAAAVHTVATDTDTIAEENNSKEQIENAASRDVNTGAIDKNTASQVKNKEETEKNSFANTNFGKSLKGLVTPMNMVMLGVTALIAIYGKLSAEYKKTIESTKTFGENLSNMSSDISEYKSKYKELSSVLNDHNATLEEQTTARQGIYDLQNEMIEQYGTEYDCINQVTSAINGEIGAWEDLETSIYDAMEAKWIEENSGAGKGLGRMFGGPAGLNFYNPEDQLSAAMEQMSDEDARSLISSVASQEAIEFYKKYNNVDITKDVMSNRDIAVLTGTYDSRVEATKQVEEDAKSALQLGEITQETYDAIIKDMKTVRNNLRIYEPYEDIYHAKIKQEDIYKDPKANGYYKELSSLYSRYQDTAKNKGINSDEAKNIVASIHEISEAAEGELKDSTYNALMDMFPEVQSALSDYEFEAYVNVKTNGDAIKSALSKFGETSELKALIDALNTKDMSGKTPTIDSLVEAGTITADQAQAYKDLLAIADTLHIGIQQLISYGEGENWINSVGKQTGLDALYRGMGINNLDTSVTKASATDYNGQRQVMANAMNSLDQNQISTLYNNQSVFKAFADSLIKNEDVNTAQEYLKKIKDYINILTKADDVKTPFIDTLTSVNSLKDGMSDLTSIYSDIKDGGEFDFSTLISDDMKEKFGDYEREYENLVKTVSKSPKNIKKCQKAFNALADAYIKDSDALKSVTSETKEAAIEELKAMGITNARILVLEQLAAKGEKLTESEQAEVQAAHDKAIAQAEVVAAGYDFINMTDEQYVSLFNEATAAGVSKNAMYEFASAQIAANLAAGKIDLSTAISQFSQLASVTYGAAAGAELMSKAADYAKNVAVGAGRNGEDYNAAYAQAMGDYLSSHQPTATSITMPTIKPSSSGGGGKGGSGGDKDTKEAINWVERAMEVLERTVERLDKKVERTWTSWTARAKALKSEITALNKELKGSKAAQSAYRKFYYGLYGKKKTGDNKKSNASILKAQFGKDWKTKVQKLIANGKIDKKYVEKYYKGSVADVLNALIEAYDQWQDQKDTSNDLKDQIMEAWIEAADQVVQKWDNLVDKWDAYNQLIQTKYLDQIEALGNNITVADSIYAYGRMNGYTSDIYDSQTSKLKEYKKAMDDFVKAGGSKDSEEYINMQTEYMNIRNSIIEAKNTIAENLQEIMNSYLEELNNKLDKIDKDITDSDFLAELLSYQGKLYFDGQTGAPNGQWITDNGMATFATILSNMESAQQKTALSQAYLKALEEAKANGALSFTLADGKVIDISDSDKYNEAMREMVDLYEENATAIYEYRDKAKSLMKEIYDAQITYLKNLSDAYTNMLDSEKDLYDYQKTITEKTKTINSLQKQLLGLEANNSEEGKNQRQQLQNQLAEAQKDLDETEYDKYISDQKEMLSKMQEDAQRYFDDKLDNISELMEEIATMVDDNTSSIEATLAGALNPDSGELITNSEASKDVLQNIYDFLNNGSLGQLGGNNPDDIIVNTEHTEEPTSQGGSSGSSNVLDDISSNLGPAVKALLMMAGNTDMINKYDAYMANKTEDTRNAFKKSVISSGVSNNMKNQILTALGTQGNGKIGLYDLVAVNGGVHAAANPPKSGTEFVDKKNIAMGDAFISKISSSAKYPYQIADSTTGKILGYVEKKSLSGYARGGVIDDDALSLSDLGLRANNGDTKLVMAQPGERILTPIQNKNFEALANALKGSNISPTSNLSALNTFSGLDANKVNVGGTINNDMSLELILPNVSNYAEFKSQLQSDTQFQKFMNQAVLGSVTGKNSLLTKRF